MPTPERVGRLIAGLAASQLERQPADLTWCASMWCSILPDLSDAELEAAVAAHLRSEHGYRWPLPAHLCRHVPRIQVARLEAEVDRSDEAWGQVRDELRERGQFSRRAWDDPTQAGIRAAGGWCGLCGATSAALDSGLRYAFRGAYQAVHARSAAGQGQIGTGHPGRMLGQRESA